VKVYRLGKVGNLLSLTLFHAMARLGYEGLILTEPADTYLSVGLLDDAPKVLDLQACQKLGVPVIRRETGGGPVLLHPQQLFYQLLLPRKLVPYPAERAYLLLSQPVLRTYRRLGLPVRLRPPNDVTTLQGKKISGQGAGEVEGRFVFVGNLLLDFNDALMARLFKVPDPHLRPFLLQALRQGLTTLKKELTKPPSTETLQNLLIEEFKKTLPLTGECEIPREALQLAEELKKELTSDLHEETSRKYPLLKIREGLYLRLARRENLSLALLTDRRTILRLHFLSEGKEVLKETAKSLIGKPYDPQALSLPALFKALLFE